VADRARVLADVVFASPRTVKTRLRRWIWECIGGTDRSPQAFLMAGQREAGLTVECEPWPLQ
jgi:hypothetical protein